MVLDALFCWMTLGRPTPNADNQNMYIHGFNLKSINIANPHPQVMAISHTISSWIPAQSIRKRRLAGQPLCQVDPGLHEQHPGCRIDCSTAIQSLTSNENKSSK
jgi:hypothetical protein